MVSFPMRLCASCTALLADPSTILFPCCGPPSSLLSLFLFAAFLPPFGLRWLFVFFAFCFFYRWLVLGWCSVLLLPFFVRAIAFLFVTSLSAAALPSSFSQSTAPKPASSFCVRASRTFFPLFGLGWHPAVTPFFAP